MLVSGEEKRIAQCPQRRNIAKAVIRTEDDKSGIWLSSQTEYFLAQYRTAEGYDRELRSVNDPYDGEYTGVVIYHVDESRSDNTTEGELMLRVVASNNLAPEVFQASHDQLWNLNNAPQFDEFPTPNSNSN